MVINPTVLAALAAYNYQWTDIANAAMAAMLDLALGGRSLRAADGRELGRISMDEAKGLYEFANQQILNAQNPGDGGVLLGVFNDGRDCGGRDRHGW